MEMVVSLDAPTSFNTAMSWVLSVPTTEAL